MIWSNCYYHRPRLPKALPRALPLELDAAQDVELDAVQDVELDAVPGVALDAVPGVARDAVPGVVRDAVPGVVREVDLDSIHHPLPRCIPSRALSCTSSTTNPWGRMLELGHHKSCSNRRNYRKDQI